MNRPAVIETLRARVDARTRRERLLLAGAALALLVLAWEFAVRAPLYGQWQRASAGAADVRRDTQQLRASTEELQRQLEAAGRDSGDSPADRLRERIAGVDEALTQRTMRVISPGQMVAVLRDVVGGEEALTLVALRNTGVEPVIEEVHGRDGSDGEEGAPANVPRVYRHRVELVVEGGYFDLLDYVERLEGLRWQFQWDGLQLETVEYPRARATISLSTLSLAEDWIGV